MRHGDVFVFLRAVPQGAGGKSGGGDEHARMRIQMPFIFSRSFVEPMKVHNELKTLCCARTAQI